MLQLLIKDEIRRYEQCEGRLLDLLERERKALEQYAQGENPKAAYVARMNQILATAANFVEASDNLVGGVMTVRQLITSGEEDLRRRLRRQMEENHVLKLYLRDLGYDPDLVHYMKIRDFQY